MSPERSPRVHASKWLWIIIGISVLLRLGSALYQSGQETGTLPGVADEVSYHELAVRVMDGYGFSFGTPWWPATRANEPTAHWSFLYVLFLTGVYTLTNTNLLAARVVQAVLVGVLHPWLAWRIGGRLFTPAVGVAAAGVTAVYGYFVFYAGALVTESLYFVALLWALDLATSLSAPSSATGPRPTTRWALLGLSLAVVCLLRQAFMPLVPVVLVWIGWQMSRRSPRPQVASVRGMAVRLALVMAVMAVCILPWTVRNYRAFGDVVPLNTNAGFVFYWGNHPVHQTEFIPIMSYGTTNYSTLLPDDVDHLNEAQLDRELMARGIQFVADDPVRYVLLSFSRAKEYFKFWPTPDSGIASNLVRVLSFGLALPLMLYGAFLAVHNKSRHVGNGGPKSAAGLVLLVAIIYSAMHLMTWSLVRYRLPVDAILMPFAGLGLVSLTAWVHSRLKREAPLQKFGALNG